jgi:hypothetical protein
MQTITTIGLDIAKSVFQVHGNFTAAPKDRESRSYGGKGLPTA